MTGTSPPRIVLVAGARPNFMKIAPLVRALDAWNASAPETPVEWFLVHTGQHYDDAMSDSFFRELGIPAPHANLGAGGGSQATQTGAVMTAFEAWLAETPVDMVVVVGDVNSTLACAVVAKKAVLDLAHVEAGLRSGDMAMPEEINRIVTDRLSDLLFTTDPQAERNLAAEATPPERVVPVGNVMIDTLLRNRERAREVTRFDDVVGDGPYGLVTLHRPSNVDDAETFRRLADMLSRIAGELRLVFPAHPRTAQRMEEFDIRLPESVFVTGPVSYLEMLSLQQDATVVLTDSGGLQEETTALGVPCLTLRENTERPVTVDEGTNTVVGTDPERILAAFHEITDGRGKAGRIPAMWDGRAAERIVNAVVRHFAGRAE